MVRRSPLTPEAQLLANEINQKRRVKARARIATLLAKKRGDLSKNAAVRPCRFSGNPSREMVVA